ncbi:MAG: hypothetical protein IPM86_08790 [Saprospiraceae bacterium]|nr:hypothetical protein [Saprospiraceae bacterium]
MKNIFFFILGIVIILSSACSKDDNNINNNNNNNNGNTKKDTGYITFKLDGREVKLDLAATAWSDSTYGTASIAGTQINGPELFQIVIEGVGCNVGQSYNLGDEKTVKIAYYLPDKSMPFTNIIVFRPDKLSTSSMKVTKRKIVPIKGYYAISATFSGVGLDQNNNTHQITDGIIYDSRSE